ncbi:MAG: glycosyltransferase family 2 protein, partial [Planctomycetota bacterium]
LHAAGKRASLVNLLLRPKVRFLKMYLLRLGFLDGKAGLVLALLSAFGVLAKYAKLWRLTEAPDRQDATEP